MSGFSHDLYLSNAIMSGSIGLVLFIAILAISIVIAASSYMAKVMIRHRDIQWGEIRHQSLFDHNPEGMFTMDKTGTILNVNSAGESITGYSKEELLDRTFPSLFGTHERMKIEGEIPHVLQGQAHVMEAAFIFKGGNFRIFQMKLIPMIKDHEVFGLYAILKDITKYKYTELGLKESEDRYKRLVELSPEPIVVHQDGLIQFVNKAFIVLLGANEPNELLGRSILDFSPGEYADIVQQRLQRLKKPGTYMAPEEEKIIRLDGKLIDVEVTGITLNYQHETSVLMMVHDITGRKQVELALREFEYKYRLITENMRDLIVVAGLDRRIKYVSPSYKPVLGISPDEYEGQLSTYLVHPGDVAHLMDAVDIVKAEKSPEKVVLRKRNYTTGEYFFFETDILPILDQNGQVKEILAISRDITERYLAEKALKTSEEKYRLIAEYSQDMIRLIDSQGLTLYASPSHKTNLDFASEEVVGKHIAEGIHPDDTGLFLERLEKAIRDRENFKTEERRQHKDGYWIWVGTNGTPVLDEEGNLKHIVLTSRDIMDRKQYEEKLKELAYCDPLTGLPNRRSFSYSLGRSIKEAERYQRMLAVLFLDLDNFKWVNDTFGHDIGDELLKQFAQRLRNSLRGSDVIARIGGDEFIILLPEIQEVQDAETAAQKILAALQEPWGIEGHSLHTTSSIGISIYPYDGENPQHLIKSADLALYQAKERGRNTYHMYA